MEGLEISEVKTLDLEFSGRLDSEYYQPKFLNYEKIVQNKKSDDLISLSNFLIGPFGSAFTVDNYTEEKTYRYIRGKDIKPLKILDNDNVYMPKQDFERLSRYALKEKDILVSVVGTNGNAALVTKKDVPAIFSCKSTVLRPFGITPEYLVTYINCKYGRELLIRKERGAIQKGLNLDDLKNLRVFVPSPDFQNKVAKTFCMSLKTLEKSNLEYKQAETLLLQEIGLKNFMPSAEKVNIKPFSQSFLTSDRLDAEYYQPKYEQFEKAVKSFAKGYTSIRHEFSHIKTQADQDKSEYKYIEIGDVNVGDGSCAYTIRTQEELPANAKYAVQYGDLLISKVRPNRGAVSIIPFKDEDVIVSGAFTVLRQKGGSHFSNEMLKVLLRTEIYREWLLKFNVGTQYPVIRDEDILDLPIPKIPPETQGEISKNIRESEKLKAKSDALLDIAKRAVEIAIEEDEAAAECYIKTECAALGVSLDGVMQHA